MSQATADLNTEARGASAYAHLPLAAAEVAYVGVLLCYAADGFVVDGEDTAGLVLAGVAAEAMDNTDGDDGDELVKVYTRGQHKFASSGLTRADVGKRLYLIDNQTVGLAANAAVGAFIFVGWMAEYISASEVWVDVVGGQAERPAQFRLAVPGTAEGVLDLSALAAAFGGADFYVTAVQHLVSYQAGDGGFTARRLPTTNYTVAAGAITLVTTEANQTLDISFTGYLQ